MQQQKPEHRAALLVLVLSLILLVWAFRTCISDDSERRRGYAPDPVEQQSLGY